MKTSAVIRWLVGAGCIAGLTIVFLFQRVDLAGALDVSAVPVYKFVFNRTIRFFANDLLTLGLIYALFQERKYILFAIYVQIAGVVFFLIPYFILKLHWPKYNGPLLSFLHRLVMNPTVLLLLIPAFYFQKKAVDSGADSK